MSSVEADNLDDKAEGSSPGINSLIAYNRKLRDQMVEARNAHQQEVRELKDSIRMLEQEVESAEERGAEAERNLQKQVEQWGAERAELKAAMEQEKLALSGREKELEAANQTLQAELEETKKALSKAESRGGSLDKLKVSLLDKARNLKAELTQSKKQAEDLTEKLSAVTSERNRLQTRLEALSGAAEKLAALEAENATLKATLQQQDEEFKLAKRYREEAEARETENARLKALAEEKVKEAEAAVKAKDEAEARAFDARRKLLDVHAEEESKDILKANLAEAIEQLKRKQQQVAELNAKLEEADKKYDEMENSLLFSSERESLRRSLSALAKRKSLGDEDD